MIVLLQSVDLLVQTHSSIPQQCRSSGSTDGPIPTDLPPPQT